MVGGYWFAVAIAAVLIVFLGALLRRRRLKEKYAVIWIGLSACIIVVGAVPRLAEWLAAAVGVELPLNLLLMAAIFVLLMVCIQLSLEVSTLEESVRTLTEEHALLHSAFEEQQKSTDQKSETGSLAEHE